VPGGFEVHRDSAGRITQSIATVSGTDGVAATVSTNYNVSTGAPLAQTGTNVTSPISGPLTLTKLALKDHLESMVAEATITGALNAAGQVSSVSLPGVNALVVHGFGPWGNARNTSMPLAEGSRGFTGHEHLADLGLIHMNGRIYDAVIGRFLQADPIIQAPGNAQSHNRYSYVLNNPLSFTDPSGFSAWTKWRSTVFAIIAAVTMQYYLMPYLMGVSSYAAMTTAQQFVTSVASGFASGGISGGNIQSALQGAFTAGLTFGLASGLGLHGGAEFGSAKHAGQVALHAAMGCGSSAMAGGSCKSGAISGGVSAFANPLLPGGNGFSAGRLVGTAIIGAIASRLSGGKAENGALSAAFSYLFNEAAKASQADPAPSRGQTVAQICAEFQLTTHIKTETVPYYERDSHGNKQFMFVTEAEGRTVQVMTREYHFESRDGTRYVMMDHHLGHVEHYDGNSKFRGAHLQVERLQADGSRISVGSAHYEYSPTHAWQQNQIRYSGGGMRLSMNQMMSRAIFNIQGTRDGF
jgi:RHS repeat-associated protein